MRLRGSRLQSVAISNLVGLTISLSLNDHTVNLDFLDTKAGRSGRHINNRLRGTRLRPRIRHSDSIAARGGISPNHQG